MHDATGLLARSSSMTTPPKPHFGIIVPVKPTAHAKSRLSPLGDDVREALVTAFAADTVTSALASPLVDLVLVVTDDHRLAAELAALGAAVIPDGAAADLNESLIQAAAELVRRLPSVAVAALCADLPALLPADLTHALEVAAEHPTSFVADASGVGTTLVAALSVEDFAPHFGPGSSSVHRAKGLHQIGEVDVPTMRHDVDTPEDLAAALAMGVGSRTTLVATGLRL